MHHATFARALSFIAFVLLLLVAVCPTAAAATPPTPSGVVPWSARCYTDTCVGFSVTFDSGHTIALGHPSDSPDSWAILDGDNLTADEETFAEATISALAQRDLPSLPAAYPALPSWYMDALAAYIVPLPTEVIPRLFLPTMLR